MIWFLAVCGIALLTLIVCACVTGARADDRERERMDKIADPLGASGAGLGHDGKRDT